MEKETFHEKNVEYYYPDDRYDGFKRSSNHAFCVFCGKQIRIKSNSGDQKINLLCGNCNAHYSVQNYGYYCTHDPHKYFAKLTIQQLEEYIEILSETYKKYNQFQKKIETENDDSFIYNSDFGTFYLKQSGYISTELRKKYKQLHPDAIDLYPRGIGNDWGDCFICGGKRKVPSGVNHNISAFVNSKKDGETVVSLFKQGAWIDYREHEPNHIQVKICACSEHYSYLLFLSHQISKFSCISKAIIENTYNMPISKFIEYTGYDLERVKNTIKRWLISDYCCYKIPVDDTLDDEIIIAKSSVQILKDNIRESRSDIKFTEYDPREFYLAPKDHVESILYRIEELFNTIKIEPEYLFEYNPAIIIGYDLRLDHILRCLDLLIPSIKHNKMDTFADWKRYTEIKCECDNPQLDYLKIYNEDNEEFDEFDNDEDYMDANDHIQCKNCGARYWYHGSWQLSTDDGWKILFPPEWSKGLKGTKVKE